MNTIEAAIMYSRRGWRVVPIPPLSKGPIIKGWQSLRLDEVQIVQAFNRKDNIGIILGEPSGWLVDVDLDCKEAVDMSDEFLPPTGAITGREGRWSSHRWYIAEGATTKKHLDPVNRDCLVEIRSTGVQTVVGPSMHPDGSRYDMLEGVPSVVDAAALAAQVNAMAEAIVYHRHGFSVEELDKKQEAAVKEWHQKQDDKESLLWRAVGYISKMPVAISGHNGHGALFSVARVLVWGFCLSEEEAENVIRASYNDKCIPPWSVPEIRHKVHDAATKPCNRPKGWLL